MSIRVDEASQEPGRSLARAMSKLTGRGTDQTMAERARAAQKAANNPRTDAPDSIKRLNTSRTTARQTDLEIWPLPGLAPMTRVRTSFGDVHAAALRKGDEVLTRSGKFKQIVWLNRISIEEHVLNLKPDCNPIVLAAGALGPGAPSSEIMISPRQIISADDVSGLSRSREAAMLLSRPGVRRLRETSLSYTMFHLGEAAEVYCEGIYLSFPLEA